MKNKILIIGLMLLAGFSYSQQDAQYTQYMYNAITVNPAYAGSKAGTSIFLLNRAQWVGLEGAPKTTNLSVNTKIKNNMGLGVSFYNDRVGPSDENNIAIDFSYTIPISDNYKLAFGLKASANLLNIDFDKLNIYDQGDYSFEENVENKFSPNIGAGVYFYSENTYFGFSAPHLMETIHFDDYKNVGSYSAVANYRIHYYFTAGHVFNLSDVLKFKPALITKIVEGAPFQLDVSGNFLFNEKFTIGVSYRMGASFSGMVGFQANNSWFFGYGYDVETTGLANYNSGSHEIFLRYDIFNRLGKIVSPRFF